MSELRRHHHRHRGRRRHARPPAGAVGQADPAPRARRLAAARDGELGRRRGVRRQPLHLDGHLVRRRRQAVPARRSTTSSAARPSSTAPRCTGCASEDFGELQHLDGISPAWPISYDDFEPYYTQAERLYQVHGNRGEDPTEPPASAPYPCPAVSHEPRIQQLFDDLAAGRLPPVPRARAASCSTRPTRPYSACIRCAHLRRLSRAWCTPSPTPRSSPSGRRSSTPTSRCSERRGRRARDRRRRPHRHRRRRRARRRATERFSADIVVVSPRRGQLRQAPARARRTTGTRTASPTARTRSGRNYMFHNSRAFLALSSEENPTRLPEDARPQRLLLRRRRLRLPDGQHPDGRQVNARRCTAARSRLETKLAPALDARAMAEHAVDFWLSTEDLPLPENRVTLDRTATSTWPTRRTTTSRWSSSTTS